MPRSGSQKGFTLIELLIVVAIIGILAAIAIPNLLTAMQRSKQKRTMADMRTIAQAWEAYAIDNNRYTAAGVAVQEPDTGSITEFLAYSTVTAKLAPDYIKTVPENDGWGNPYLFGVNTNGTNYGIASFGKDGTADTDGSMGPTTNFDCDIIYENGSFTKYPEGAQGAASPQQQDDQPQQVS